MSFCEAARIFRMVSKRACSHENPVGFSRDAQRIFVAHSTILAISGWIAATLS